MDKIIESRMNRSLLIHGLENLVFEKRQRKSIQPQPHTLPTILIEKKISKKKQKTTNNKPLEQKNKLQKEKQKKSSRQ